MVALLMTEIFNFTTIEDKKSSRSFSYKKFHKRQNDRKGQYTHLRKRKKLKLN